MFQIYISFLMADVQFKTAIMLKTIKNFEYIFLK